MKGYKKHYSLLLSKQKAKNQLNLLDGNFIDYLEYWNEKYYRNGFCDGVQIVMGCFDE